jgi:hypothetical protein
VIILDENILEGQRLLLEAWNISPRQIGLDMGRKGLNDEQIIVLLRELRRPTFFSRDLGLYTPALRDHRYAIVVTAVRQYEVAAFVRRFLRHPMFDTKAKRTGKIIRLSSSGIGFWQTRRQQETAVGWERRG